jgi:hypothetical protein
LVSDIPAGDGKTAKNFLQCTVLLQCALPGVSIPRIATDAAATAVLIVLNSVPPTVHLVVVVILQIGEKNYYFNVGCLIAKTEKIVLIFFRCAAFRCDLSSLLVRFHSFRRFSAQIPGIFPVFLVNFVKTLFPQCFLGVNRLKDGLCRCLITKASLKLHVA